MAQPRWQTICIWTSPLRPMYPSIVLQSLDMSFILNREWLQNATVDELRQACDMWQVPHEGLDRQELIDTIIDTLDERVQRINEKLGSTGDEQRPPAEDLYHEEGVTARQLRPDRPMGETIYEEEIQRQQAEDLGSSMRYKPLEALRSIRVVILLPAKEEDAEIKCIIRHTNLDEPLGYLALSYTWGHPDITKPIMLNGHEFQVTTNLESALRRLRHDTMALGYWIDALCINQADLDERGSQVKLMKDIYEESNGVVAWLGEEAELSDLALEKMMEIRQYEADGLQIDEIVRRAVTSGRGLDEEWYAEPWAGLEMLFMERPDPGHPRNWWYRIWCAPEASTPRVEGRMETRIVCGSRYATWSAVMSTVNLIMLIMSQPGMEWFARMGTAGASRIDQMKRQREDGEAMPLLEVLNSIHPCGATDPRDRVYAGLALATDIELGGFRVDYSLPVTEVYTDVVREMLDRRRDFDWLGYCHLLDNGPKVPGLPSWVPDWTHTDFVADAMPKRMYDKDGDSKLVYNAGAAAILADVTTEPLGTIKGAKLTVRGIPLGTITSTHASSLQAGDPPTTTIQDITVEQSWAPTTPSSPYLPTGETTQQAYLRTIVGDLLTIRGSTPVKRGHAMSFDKLHDFQKQDDENEYMAEMRKLTEVMGPMKIMTGHRRFAYLDGGYMGLVPRRAEVGDEVFIFRGGQVPFVVRRRWGDDGVGGWKREWTFVGECYVHGVMDGEAMMRLERGEAEWEDVALV